MPRCRGRGGVPHKHTGRVGGKNYVRQALLRKSLPWEKVGMRVKPQAKHRDYDKE